MDHVSEFLLNNSTYNIVTNFKHIQRTYNNMMTSILSGIKKSYELNSLYI